jgi:hypothetical protein
MRRGWRVKVMDTRFNEHPLLYCFPQAERISAKAVSVRELLALNWFCDFPAFAEFSLLP